jgi:hypothetical protein
MNYEKLLEEVNLNFAKLVMIRHSSNYDNNEYNYNIELYDAFNYSIVGDITIYKEEFYNGKIIVICKPFFHYKNKKLYIDTWTPSDEGGHDLYQHTIDAEESLQSLLAHLHLKMHKGSNFYKTIPLIRTDTLLNECLVNPIYTPIRDHWVTGDNKSDLDTRLNNLCNRIFDYKELCSSDNFNQAVVNVIGELFGIVELMQHIINDAGYNIERLESSVKDNIDNEQEISVQIKNLDDKLNKLMDDPLSVLRHKLITGD